MSHEPFETQVSAYVVGALDGEERTQFEDHLARGCAACAAAVRELNEALADVARADTPLIPPAEVRAALMRRVAIAPATRAPWGRRRVVRWTATAAAAVVAVSGFVAGLVSSRYEARIGVMVRETAALRADLQRGEAALREQAAAAQAVLALLGDPATRVVALRGQGPSPEATGRLVWNETGGGRLFVANLPPTPEGKAYELWTISGGRPQPAGVFKVDASGRASQPVKAAGGPVDVFAVTLEPEAGVPAPTGAIVLASAK